MRIPALCAAVLAAVSVLAAAPAAQQQPPAGTQAQPPAQQQSGQQQPPPRIRTGINYVRVDVIVSDKNGNPVEDLKPEEFSVTEDNKPQQIESFALVKVDQATQVESGPPRAIRTDYDEEREAARADVRLFVILLDDYHVRRGSDMAVRKPLADFIQNQLSPLDMVALMYPLTPVSDLRFTRDHASIIRAIEKFEGRKFMYEPRNEFEQRYAYYPASVVERVRNQVTMSALKGAAVRMGGLREGRKSIIFVSEGFTTTLPNQLNDPIAAMPGLGNPNRNNPGAPVASDRQKMIEQMDLNSELRDLFTIVNRQNTSIYSVDPRGLAVFEYAINEGVGMTQDLEQLRSTQDTLYVLADNTDGRAIVNRNDLASGMKQIIRDSSAYYLLGYNSSQAPTDGKFHEIKVRVSRKGVSVRARKGYWAYTEDDAARAAAPPKPEPPSAVTSALSELAEPARGRPARFWIGTTRGANGGGRVTFVWQASASAPGAAREVAAGVSLTATRANGEPVYRGKLVPAPGGVGPAGGSVAFDVPPGPLQLRLSVEGARGEVLDTAVRELTVPDFSAVEVSLGTPRVLVGRTVRDLQALKTNPDAAPTAAREFSRTERILVRVEAYGPGGVAPTVTARLLNRGGTAMSDLPVQPGPAGASDIEVPVAALAAGDYLIELNAKAPGGTAQELLAFRVGR